MFLMRENDVTPSNVMEMKIDVPKNQNGIRTALNNVTRFRPVNLLQNKTRFFFISYRGNNIGLNVKCTQPVGNVFDKLLGFTTVPLQMHNCFIG